MIDLTLGLVVANLALFICNASLCFTTERRLRREHRCIDEMRRLKHALKQEFDLIEAERHKLEAVRFDRIGEMSITMAREDRVCPSS